MKIVGIVLVIIFLIAAIAAFVMNVLHVRGFVKSPIEAVDHKKILKKSLILNISFAVAMDIAINMIYLAIEVTPLWWEVLLTVLLVPTCAFALATLYTTFRIHYYRRNLPQDIDKKLYYAMCISLPVLIISLWYSFNGFANYITYPIPNGISFTEGWTHPNSVAGGFSIAFYALSILSGALFVYFLCDHKMYQQYGKHGIIESTFLVAFPAGILGARIWYVIGNWKVDGFDQDPLMMFRIWEGGLTILGGAIMGIVVGVLWFIWRNKQYSIWIAVDMIVPTILLAQAIGRLGNFFNCEVHGNPVPVEAWNWLPQIIVRNGMFSSSEPALTNGTFYLPLFLIEGVLNIGGYFVIASLFGKKFRKYTELGDLGFAYVVVYGVIRSALEPLRNTSFNMGENGYWSWIFSCLFVVFGTLGIFGNHLVRHLIRKKKNKVKQDEDIHVFAKRSLIVGGSIAGVLLVTGTIFMIVGEPVLTSLVYNLFNAGVILLCAGVGVLLLSANSIIYLFETRKPVVQNEGGNA